VIFELANKKQSVKIGFKRILKIGKIGKELKRLEKIGKIGKIVGLKGWVSRYMV